MNRLGFAALVVLTVIFVAALWFGFFDPPARAQDGVIPIRTKTGSYQLDTGDFVHWWIDEDRALLCTALGLDGRDRGGYALSCLPLSQTVYAWPIPPSVK